MMILFSVLSKITGVKIQRDCTTTNCSNQPGDSSESRDQNLSSNCYKVANSTFYIVIQSDSTDSADIDHDRMTFLTPCNVSEGMHRDDLIPLVPLRPHAEGGLPVQPLMATLPSKKSKVADSCGSPPTHNCKDVQWPSTNSNGGTTDEYPKLTACSDLTETQEAETLLHSTANHVAHHVSHLPIKVHGARTVTAVAKGEDKSATCVPLVGHPFMSDAKDANRRQPRTTMRDIDVGATALASLEANLHKNDGKMISLSPSWEVRKLCK